MGSCGGVLSPSRKPERSVHISGKPQLLTVRGKIKERMWLSEKDNVWLGTVTSSLIHSTHSLSLCMRARHSAGAERT